MSKKNATVHMQIQLLRVQGRRFMMPGPSLESKSVQGYISVSQNVLEKFGSDSAFQKYVRIWFMNMQIQNPSKIVLTFLVIFVFNHHNCI